MAEIGNECAGYNAHATTARVADNVIPKNFPLIDRPPLRVVDRCIRPQIPFLTKRYTVAFLSSIGFMIVFAMDRTGDIVYRENIRSLKIEQTVLWAANFGSCITTIVGGLIATVFPANKLFGAAILFCSFLNLWPVLFTSPYLKFVCIFLRRSAMGVLYPTCIGVMRHWAPPLERSRLITLAFSGTFASIPFDTLAVYISGNFIDLRAWYFPFYLYGILGIVWYLSWIWLVFEKPTSHTFIETKELIFIESSLREGQTRCPAPTLINAPWKALLTSPHFYATVVANFCKSFTYFLNIFVFIYLIRGGFQSKSESIEFVWQFWELIANIILTITLPFGGILADWLQKKKILTTTQVRKLFTCGGFGMEAISLIILAFCDIFPLTVTILCIQIVFRGLGVSGCDVNHLDIAPRYASILTGISKGIGSMTAYVYVYIVEQIVSNWNIDDWWPIHITMAVINCLGLVFYGIFASGEEQRWARPTLRQQTLGRTSNEIPMHTIQRI